MEKIFVIPLRKARRGTSRKFAPKAARYVAEFVKRHMKVEEVVIGPELNEFIWSRGITNPPRRVEVKAEKKDNAVHVNLSVIRPKPKAAEKKAEKKPEPKEEKKAEHKEEKKPEPREEHKAEPKEEKKAEAKAEHKPEKKAEAKSKPKKAPAKAKPKKKVE
jgi:large subunit ribosomal protein L31e